MKSIHAEPMSIEDVFSKHRFVIPDFQRPYSWEEDQCEQLLSDLLAAFQDSPGAASDENRYFLGNIIYYPAPLDSRTWIIVDGQQRLTTLLLLMHALYKATRDSYTSLRKSIFTVKKDTGEVTDEIRLASNVPPGEKGYGRDDLKKVLTGGAAEISKKNPFRQNYRRLNEILDEWWKNNEENWQQFIEFFNEKVMLLPIQCESEWDALDLFQIINDRGVPLDDADVFKARIYREVADDDKPDFIGRWNELGGHLNLFQIYMNIDKAQNAPAGAYSTKRIKLRKYMDEEVFKNKKKPLKKRWESVMDSLELCHFYKTNVGYWANDEIFSQKEKIFWAILGKYPNETWQYPLFVFMHKHAKFDGGELVLSENKKRDYMNLLESSVRFFYIRGAVRNSIEFVRTAAYKVCVQIEKDEDYFATYKAEYADDLRELEGKLLAASYGKGYSKGLVLLNAFLNPQQAAGTYAGKIFDKIEIEHILPKPWRINDHYEQWDENSHSEWVEKIGNLVPLEKKVNIRSSDNFFRVKQAEYKKSGIKDALDLSAKKPAHWHPEDAEARHQEAVARLMAFFRG